MNTAEPRLLRVEVVADLPVLWATLQRLDLPAILDRHFPAPLHWKGPLTPGEVLAVWLLFVVTEGDHCLNHVESWVEQHQGTLSALMGKSVLPTDAHDDRLADWLTRLGAGASFGAVERDLGGGLPIGQFRPSGEVNCTLRNLLTVLEHLEQKTPGNRGAVFDNGWF